MLVSALASALIKGSLSHPQSDRPLALPHLSVADIRWVDWRALAAAGFKGCVFDKDNTLTGALLADYSSNSAVCGLAPAGRPAACSWRGSR